ncbi:hypothetical protein ACFXKG_30780 [Streptomyces sp. NPDC059255]|uniref:hypothetical protein n=1 Tax=Streptomyces sp. NPDC059255 TaxID=3346793 RepID=UPI0036C870C7
MASTPRAQQIANSVIEGASATSALFGGAVGAYLGYQTGPASWSGEIRILLAGAAAVVGAVAIDALVDLAIAPLRRRLANSRYRTPARELPALPGSLADSIATVAAAAAGDAADQAAMAARIKLDRCDDGSFLTAAERWTGYENGEASLFLAPGAQLHFAFADDRHGYPERTFTLLTSQQDAPVAITTLAQLHQHLLARESGLPVPQPADSNTARSAA